MSLPADASLRLCCPRCGTWLQARPAHVGRSLPCPKCGAAIQVAPPPPPSDAPENEYAIRDLPYGAREIPREQHCGPVVPVALPPEELPAGPEEDAPPPDEKTRAISERPKLPPWPMFTGVLAVFSDPRMWTLWIGLAIVGTLLLGLGSYSVASVSVEGRGLGTALPWIVGLLAGLITFALGLIWFVVSVVYSLAVLQDSAAGNDRIANWPDAVWIDWFGEAFYVLTALILSGGLGYSAGWLLGGSMASKVACIGGGLYLLFPIILLSALEMQSPLAPLSPVVLASMVRSWRSWGLFYLETGVLGGFVLGTGAVFLFTAMAIAGGRILFTLLLVASCPMAVLAVGAQLLYFRLLGRLTWISAEASRKAMEEQSLLEEEAESREEPEGDPPIHPTPVDDF